MGRGSKKAFERVGDGGGLEEVCKDNGKEFLEKKVSKGLRVKRDQEWQSSWGKIDRSRYCKDYGKWKEGLGRKAYWENRKWGGGECKEQWARLRCGNIGREASKDFKETRCRVCGEAEENV